MKQGNREYIDKLFGVPYPPENVYDSKSFINLQFKSRDKFSDQTLPLIDTMIDSFQFHNKQKVAGSSSNNSDLAMPTGMNYIE